MPGAEQQPAKHFYASLSGFSLYSVKNAGQCPGLPARVTPLLAQPLSIQKIFEGQPPHLTPLNLLFFLNICLKYLFFLDLYKLISKKRNSRPIYKLIINRCLRIFFNHQIILSQI